MSRVLIAGLPDRLAAWLAQRLPRVLVEVTYTGDGALDSLGEGDWSLLVVDASITDCDAESLVRRLRGLRSLAALPVILTLDPQTAASDETTLRRMVDELRVERILLAPIDRGELGRQVAALLAEGREGEPARSSSASPSTPPASDAPAPGGGAPAAREEMEAALAAAWTRALPGIRERVGVLSAAVSSAAHGTLGAEARHAAHREAHRLAGALGTFGLPHGTELARRLEHALSANAVNRAEGERLLPVVTALRREVESRASPSEAEGGAVYARKAQGATQGGDGRPLLLVVDDDAEYGAAVAAEAERRGIRARSASRARAGAVFTAERPDALLLDLSGEEDGGPAWRLLAGLADRAPDVAVLVSTTRDALLDRVRALQMGARRFLLKPLPAADAAAAAARLLPAAGAGTARVLAVDDDPAVLGALRALLEPQRLEVHTLDSPLGFIAALRQARPDLLVLDVDMPHLDGIELCRVARADARWGEIPIVFLTARTDAETVRRVFAAGADDFVVKPFVGPELLARIRSRLERLAPRP